MFNNNVAIEIFLLVSGNTDINWSTRRYTVDLVSQKILLKFRVNFLSVYFLKETH